MIKDILPIIHKAGDIILSYYEGEYAIAEKSHATDYVTTADTETEKYLRDSLQTLLSGSQFLGEESHETITDRSGYVRIVDPLDGTKNFVLGNGRFGTILGLCHNGEPIVGVVHYPTVGKTLYAEKGIGAYLLSGSSSTPEKIILPTVPKDYVHDNDTTGFGSIAWLLLQMCEGVVYGAFRTHSHWHKWDTCGLEVVLKEAGGVIKMFDGSNLDYTQDKSFWEGGVCIGNSDLLLTL